MIDLKKALIPYPKKVCAGEESVKIAELSKPLFKLETDGDGSDVFCEAQKFLKQTLGNVASTGICDCNSDFVIRLCIDEKNSNFDGISPKEAYSIDISENSATLCGADAEGAFYAAVTFKQLVYTEGAGVYLPQCAILDYPSSHIRGHYMESRYGSDFMTLEDWMEAVDYFSEMKINHLFIGVYGCWAVQYDRKLTEFLNIPIKRYPELKTPRDIKYYSVNGQKWVYKKDALPTMYENDYFGDLIAYAKKKNIKIIPQFNSYGHNTLLPRVFPQISVKDENGNDTGFGLCTENEATYEVIFNIYDEIIERYLKPNGIDSFEIGFDEIWSMIGVDPTDIKKLFSCECQCDKCKNTAHIELVIRYLIRILKHLKEAGIKNVYAYHDVLFNNNAINEQLAERLKKEGVYDILVIDWWCYHYRGLFHAREAEVNSACRSIIKPWTGYFHWDVPSDSTDNITMCAKLGPEKKMEGLVAYGAYDIVFDRNFLFASECSWNYGSLSEEFSERYVYKYYRDDYENALDAFKQVREFSKNKMWGEGLIELEYYDNASLHADKPYPRNYPGDVFAKILDKREEYTEFLINTKNQSQKALEYFENTRCIHKINSMWKMVSLQYNTLSKEYLEMINISDKYESGEMSSEDVIGRVEALIFAREKLMKSIEEVKIEANTYQILRNMSINRQYLCDMRDYFICENKKGNRPKLDITNLEYLRSEMYYFLR